MKGIWTTLAAAALVLSVTADTAKAEGASLGLGVSHASAQGYGTVGFGGNVLIPIRDGSTALNLDGRYELSLNKLESGPSTEETNVAGFRFRVGVDRRIPVGETSTIYFGSGATYARHKVTLKETGQPDTESDPYTLWGVGSTLGASTPLGGSSRVEAFGQVEVTYGRGSLDSGSVKLTQTDVTTGFQSGIRFRLGS